MEGLRMVTRSLPGVVRDPLIALIGKECYTSLVWNIDISDVQCIKYSVSKAMGLGLVAGGGIVKIPQILKVLRSGSARGLSLASYLLDTAGLLITVAYNARQHYPFSTYGENAFLSVQNVIIVFLIFAFSRSSGKAFKSLAFAGTLAASTYSLFSSDVTPISVLRNLIVVVTPLSLASKIPQIATIFSNGSTGQLSAFLVFSSLAGTLGRVFTTMTETGDNTLWWSYVSASALNAVIALQMLYYWNKDSQIKPRSKTATSFVKVNSKDEKSDSYAEVAAHTPAPSAPVVDATPSKPVGAAINARTPAKSTPRSSSTRYTRKVD